MYTTTSCYSTTLIKHLAPWTGSLLKGWWWWWGGGGGGVIGCWVLNKGNTILRIRKTVVTYPVCLREAVSCGNVAKVAHGRTLVGMTTYQSKAFYTCNKGYELEGSSVMTCGEDGTWLGTEPSCKGNQSFQPKLIKILLFSLSFSDE